MIKILWDEIRSVDSSRKALRSFGILVGGVVLAVAVFVLWKSGWKPGMAVYILAGVGGALMLLGATAPRVLKPVFLVWMALAVVLGYVMTRVILTVVFYAVVSPIGLIMRAVGRDPLERRLDPDAKSYWLEKTYPHNSPKRLEKYY